MQSQTGQRDRDSHESSDERPERPSMTVNINVLNLNFFGKITTHYLDRVDI